LYAIEVARLINGKNVIKTKRRQFSLCANKQMDKQQPTIFIFEVGLASLNSSFVGSVCKICSTKYYSDIFIRSMIFRNGDLALTKIKKIFSG